jgi:3-hydroxyacyl-CoA dehydrogenase/enoyl-CoA hydratase/3-hydroxybutyryl-CoA epimerase
MALLAESIHPAMIENVGRMAGMPMGPLEVMDSVGVDTALKITRATRKELGREGNDAAEDLLSWLVEKSGRPGRKIGKGFYDYDAKGKRLRLWPDLVASRTAWRTDCNVNEMKARFLSIQALEAARCFEEGVITDPRDADVGAILGWGFAPFTGGPISWIDTMGAAAFVQQCEGLAARYGDRFAPNRLLREMASTGETFYARFAPQKRAA